MTFFGARGCVYCVQRSGGGGGGFAIGDLVSSGCPPLLINGVQLQETDVVLPVTTLNNTSILYVFGGNLGNVTISGTAFLGPQGTGQMEQVVAFVRNNRVSNSLSTVPVSFPGGSLSIYVTGMGLSPADPEFNLQPFAITGMVASPP